MFITRFQKPGATSKAASFNHLTNAGTELNQFIKDQSSKIGQPHFWSFSDWSGGPSKANHVEASAIVLEYDAKADHNAIQVAINSLELACYTVTTARGKAYIFPLEETVLFGRYTRLAAVLAEQIDEGGLIKGCAGAQYLIRVEDNTKVLAKDGDLIPSDYHFQTTDLCEPIDTWYPLNTTPKLSLNAIAEKHLVKSTPNSMFDEFFEVADRVVESAAEMRRAAINLRKIVEGQ